MLPMSVVLVRSLGGKPCWQRSQHLIYSSVDYTGSPLRQATHKSVPGLPL